MKNRLTAPDCLDEFARGYCHASDLCGPCTARLMVAVDWVTHRDNRWHGAYVERARDRCDGQAGAG